MGNRYFRLFNVEIARAITANTRFYLQLLNYRINNYIKEKTGYEDSVLYNDTDSVVGSTVIDTSQGRFKIEELYDLLNGEIEILGENNYVKHITNKITTPSVNDDIKIEQKQIKHIMKHKVKKKLYKITVFNSSDKIVEYDTLDSINEYTKSVTVTQDHSVIVLRNGKKLSVKPGNIQKTDSLLYNTISYKDSTDIQKAVLYNLKETNDFIIEDLGVQEEYVYDIEVDDNHNFFGNDILVHNSGYFTLESVMKKFYTGKDDILEKVDFLDKWIKTELDPIIQECNDEFGDLLNAFEPDAIKAEREAIADRGVFLAKKKYYLRVFDNEGVKYAADDPYMKTMGIELVRSSTPPFVKKYLTESIKIILDKNQDELIDWLDKVKQQFISQPLSNIAKTTSVSNLNYNLDNSVNPDGSKLAIPINSRAALASNRFIQSSPELYHRFTQISAGDKVKLLYLKLPNKLNQNVFAFIDPAFGELFRDDVDFDLCWEKYFMSALNIMVAPIGWNIEKRTEALDEW